jgi:hypothetical protein
MLRISAILGWGLNRTIRKRTKEVVDGVDKLVTQLTACVRIEVEIHGA